MSYRDSGDDRYVSIKLVVIRNWMDQLARVREQNNLNKVLWGQIAGEYQRLRAQPSPGIEPKQETKESEYGSSPASS